MDDGVREARNTIEVAEMLGELSTRVSQMEMTSRQTKAWTTGCVLLVSFFICFVLFNLS